MQQKFVNLIMSEMFIIPQQIHTLIDSHYTNIRMSTALYHNIKRTPRYFL